MRTDLFDYELPPERIAQRPCEPRDASRLLLVDRQRQTLSHHTFGDLPALLRPATRLFRNNARVLKARLHGQRPTGGQVECLLLRPAAEADTFWCLVKPGRKLGVGATFGVGEAQATVTAISDTGERAVHFALGPHTSVTALAEACGELPLPPYIHREGCPDASDDLRYQTVFAAPDRTVAAAAPTAGLHFTPELLGKLAAQGHRFHDLTLHVGLDTFRPIQTDHVEAHPIHREFYEIPAETRAALEGPGGPRLAIGTTSLRSVEDYTRQCAPESPPGLWAAEASLFIYPPDTCQGIDQLLTNFHLPRSTLLCLVSAVLTPGSTDGIAWLKEIYAEAIARQYRFFSYGDAMLIL